MSLITAFTAAASFAAIPTSPASLLNVEAGVPFGQAIDALIGLSQVPLADRALLALYGLRVDLIPYQRVTGNDVGLTIISTLRNGRSCPTSITVAANAGQSLEPTHQILAHEVGHAVSVLRTGNRSEFAAEMYAHTVLRSPADQAISSARMLREGMNPNGVVFSNPFMQLIGKTLNL